MSITSTKDIIAAYNAGKHHTQRFFKNAGTTGDAHWQDWSFTSGQPAYDARIGDALAFTPFTAAGNDAIYFPSKGASETRHIVELGVYCTASGTGQLTVQCQIYDLLGVYPLIDGDSTDLQSMDNSLTLPRYTNGVGVRAILVNHVSPVVTAGNQININYIDADNVSRSMSVFSAAFGLGKASFTIESTGTSTGALYLPTDGRGVKSITDITCVTAPGGLWAIYLVQPIEEINWQGGAASVTNTIFAEKHVASTSSFLMPKIEDGAWLGMFYMPNGSSRTVALFGYCKFVWG